MSEPLKEDRECKLIKACGEIYFQDKENLSKVIKNTTKLEHICNKSEHECYFSDIFSLWKKVESEKENESGMIITFEKLNEEMKVIESVEVPQSKLLGPFRDSNLVFKIGQNVFEFESGHVTQINLQTKTIERFKLQEPFDSALDKDKKGQYRFIDYDHFRKVLYQLV